MNCNLYNNCPTSPVLIGYSSETPDAQIFIGLGYAPATPPPLGWTFTQSTAFAIRDSIISQADANARSAAAALYAVQQDWTAPGGIPAIVPEETTLFDRSFDWGNVEPLI